jgi:hypothetical protein
MKNKPMPPEGKNSDKLEAKSALYDAACSVSSSFGLGLRFKMNADPAGRFGLSQSNSAVDVGHGIGNSSTKRKEWA